MRKLKKCFLVYGSSFYAYLVNKMVVYSLALVVYSLGLLWALELLVSWGPWALGNSFALMGTLGSWEPLGLLWAP
jgi:hypothetical protein